jgi:hypothetical protein
MKKKIVTLCAAGAAMAASAIEIDRSVMSDGYWKVWNDAEQARIDADIEANRKADGVFAVGAPAGAVVKVEQLTHSFRFGAHIFNFNQLGRTEYNDVYKAMFGKGGLFNQATVSFYWIDHEPTPGGTRADGKARDQRLPHLARLPRAGRRPDEGGREDRPRRLPDASLQHE